MNRFWRLWRTTTFRLTALFLAIFVVLAVAILGYIAYQSVYLIQQQQVSSIERELNQLESEYTRGGTRGLVLAIQRFAQGPGPGIYYVADPNGVGVAGNVLDVPAEVLQQPGAHTFNYQRPFAQEGDVNLTGVAMVRSFILPSGFYLVVGRDIVERRSFAVIVLQAFFWGVLLIVIFGVVAGAVSAQRVLRRIDSITATSEAIMAGAMGERVPVTKRGDEFDRLATSLNAMLDRIQQLVAGMKAVSDNIAHDLKTPLTRMRNRIEAALREGKDAEAAREALESTIEESDQLIKTFNALLLIARVEAGTAAGDFERVDLSEAVNDLAELYAPVAEDAEMTLKVDAGGGVNVRANRELVGQALVNLVENALKYGKPANGGGEVSIRVSENGGEVALEVADRGPGIPEADRERVLERFVRLDESRAEPGFGLGLSLVSAVAHLHKGRVEIADNSPGARIRLILPKA